MISESRCFHQADALFGEWVELRRSLHRHPELGNREFSTAEKIRRYLHHCGFEITLPFGTATVAILKGGLPGKTVALRSDMDALPIREATGLPFASENPGVMHACGHDFHMTFVLGAAKLLSMQKDRLRGSVMLIFEPDEEGSGGAQRLMETGLIDRAQAVFGCHVDPTLPVKTIGLKPGHFYAASNPFSITFHGKSCHAARPQDGTDCLFAAAETAVALRNLTDLKSASPRVVSVCTIHGGTAVNVLPESVEITGIIRTHGEENRRDTLAQVQKLALLAAGQTGTQAKIRITDGYLGVENDPRDCEFVRRFLARCGLNEQIRLFSKPLMTTEDFGCFTHHKAGQFFHIGVGGSGVLHSPVFCPDEAALPFGVAVLAGLCEEYLNQTETSTT